MSITNFTYQQWLASGKCSLQTLSSSADEFIENFSEQVHKLKKHSFTAKAQASFLKNQKATLGNDEIIILLDFTENYSYVLQDEVQSFHWNNNQCTLHPVVVYYKSPDTENLCSKSICVVSDDKEHDVAFVYEVQVFIASFVKAILPSVCKITYYSDGSASQYKNYKNFVNLCLHKSDFNFKARWMFFATSHGKSPCDGIGGTVKRLVRRESLQHPYSYQIAEIDAFFKY